VMRQLVYAIENSIAWRVFRRSIKESDRSIASNGKPCAWHRDTFGRRNWSPVSMMNKHLI